MTTAVPATKSGPLGIHFQKQTLVQIAIAPDDAGNLEIRVYPQRESDVVVYRKFPGKKQHPAKPEEVRWVVDGLGPTQRLKIEGKPGQTNPFGAPYFEIQGGNETITSGRPVNAGVDTWKYNITLFDGNTVLASYDPTIEIKDDP